MSLGEAPEAKVAKRDAGGLRSRWSQGDIQHVAARAQGRVLEEHRLTTPFTSSVIQALRSYPIAIP